MSTGIVLVDMSVETLLCHIHLTAKNWLEDFGLELFGLGLACLGLLRVSLFLSLFGSLESILYRTLSLGVFLGYIVVELLDAEHVAMIGYGEGRHTVGHGLVDKSLHWRLSVKH